MSLLDDLISDASEPILVSRRGAGAFVDARWVPATPTTETVTLSVQSRTKSLFRQTEGDSTAGQVDVWADLDDLAVVGWTELQIAPSKTDTPGAEGPPGDQFDWRDDHYELTSKAPHDGTGPLMGGFQRYVATLVRVAT